MDSVVSYLNVLIKSNVFPSFPTLVEFNTIDGNSQCDEIRIQLGLDKINNVDPYQKFYDFFTTMDPSNLTPFMNFCGMINKLDDKVPLLKVFLSSNLVSHIPFFPLTFYERACITHVPNGFKKLAKFSEKN